MVKVETLRVGSMAANCYILFDSDSNAVIIDPGDDAELIINRLRDFNLTPKAILATHGHFDHIMASLELKLAFNIPLYMSEKDNFLLERMRETAIHFLGTDPGPAAQIDFSLKDKMNLLVGEITLKVIATPGHTPGSVCFVEKSSKSVFVGDLVFSDGSVGETSHKYSDERDLKKSLRTILKLPGDYTLFSGHGEPVAMHLLQENLF